MATQEFSTRLDIEVGKGHKELDTATEKHEKLIAGMIKRLDQLDGRLEKVDDSLRKTGKAHKDVAAEVKLMIRQQKLINKLMRETGSDAATAGKIVRRYGKDIDKAEKEAEQFTRQLSALKKETKSLTRAQRVASTGTTSYGGAAKRAGVALLGFAAAALSVHKIIQLVTAGLRFGFESFKELENAVVSLSKVTDQLADEELSGLVERLEDLSTSTVPIATDQLIELAAVAGQLGIKTAEGLARAAETGAKLAAATDLSGEVAIKSLARIIAIQGESIQSIDSLGSALVKLGNTSKATEAEIIPIANEIARSTASLKLGSPVILGFAAALAEMGARAEGSASALSELLDAMVKASVSGEGLEGLAEVAGVTADELRRMIDDDVTGAALQFLEGLNTKGRAARIALEGVGLDAKRTAKALVPLATGIDRVRDRLEVSGREAMENTALNKEAAAAFSTLAFDVQRATNALKLAAAEGFAALAPPISRMLSDVVELTNFFRDFAEEMKNIPAIMAAAGLAISLVEGKVGRMIRELKAIPGIISLIVSTALTPMINSLGALAAALPFGGEAAQELLQPLRELQASLIQLAAFSFKESAEGAGPEAGFVDIAEAADEVADRVDAAAIRVDALAAAVGRVSSLGGAGRERITLFGDLQDLPRIMDKVLEPVKLIKENVETTADRLREQEEVWFDIADAAFEVADAIGGRWGDLLGDLIGGVLRLRDAWKEARRVAADPFATRTDRALAGFGVGQAAGGLVSGLGISTGAGQAGGALSGIFGGLGALTGLPGAGIIGGIIGELVGGLNIFQSGGDDAIETFKLLNGVISGTTRKVEGSLGPAISQFGQAVSQGFNAIITSLGATVTSLADIEIKLRQDGEKVVFRLIQGGKDIAEFADQAQAVGEAIKRLLQQSDIEGLSSNVAAALKNTLAATFEQLAADLAVAQLVDARLMSQGELFLAARVRLLREELQITSRLGISQQDVIDGRIAEENALNRLAESQALQLAGIDQTAAAGLAQFDAAREQAAQTEALQAAYDDAAAAASVASQETTGFAMDLGDLAETLGLSDERFERLRERFDDLELGGATFGEALEIVAGEIEGIDLATLEQAAEAFSAGQRSGFFSRIAEFTGDAQLAAQALELEHRMRLIQFRLTVQQFAALGLLTRAEESRIRLLLDEQEILGAPTGAPPPTGGGRALRGGGGGRRRAAEDFRRAADEVSLALAGLAPAELAHADRVRQLTERAEAGSIGIEELDRAIENLAALDLGNLRDDAREGLRELGQTDLSNAMRALRESFAVQLSEALALAADNPEAYEQAREAIERGLAASLRELGRDVLDSFGFRMRSIRQAGKEAVRQIEFLADHLDELGLTAAQVATNVRGGILPGLVDLAISSAQAAFARTGSKEDEQRVLELQAEKQELERKATLLQLKVWEQMLIAANALDDQTRRLIAGIRDDLAEPIEVRILIDDEEVDRRRPFVRRTVRAGESFRGSNPPAAGGGSSPAEALGRSLADIIRELEANARSPLEALQFQFSELFDEIASAAGTAAERLQAQALAEAELARRRQEIQEEMFSGVTSFLDELDRTARADLAPRGAAISAREAFREASRAVDPTDQASVDAALRAAMEYRELLVNYNRLIGGGERSALVRSVEDQIRQLLGSIVPPPLPPPGAAGLPGVGGSDLSDLPPASAPLAPAGGAGGGGGGGLSLQQTNQILELIRLGQDGANVRERQFQTATLAHQAAAQTAFDQFAAHASGGAGF